MQRKAQQTVVVIGGGISGLSAAYELQKAGFLVDVFDKETAGGRMRTERPGNLPFDSGADFLAENYTTLRRFASELGIEWIPTKAHGTHRIMRNGKAYYLSLEKPSDILRFDIIPFWERVRLLFFAARLRLTHKNLPSFFDLQELSPALDAATAGDYMTQKVGSETKQYIADAFTALMQFHTSDEISSGAMMSLLNMMTSPKSTFALRYTVGGIGAIPEALGKKVELHENSSVTKLVRQNDGVVATVRDVEKKYDYAVVAAPAYAAKELVGDLNDSAKQFLNSVQYAATMVAAFRVPSTLFTDRSHCTYVPLAENKVVSGYTNESRKGFDAEQNGEAVLAVYLHEAAARELMDKSDAEIFETVSAELQKVCPEVHGKKLQPYALRRWPNAMPKFAHKHVSAVVQFLRDEQGKGAVYWAGDYLNAPWTEGSARGGVKVAKLIIEDSKKNQK